SATRDLLAVFDLNGAPVAGEAFDLSLSATADVVAEGASSALPVSPTGTTPFTGGTKTVAVASLALANPGQPGAGNVLANATRGAMLRGRATAGAAEPVKLTQVTLRPTAASTGNDANATVRLFLDVNQDGALDAGDLLLGTQPGNDVAVTFLNAAG